MITKLKKSSDCSVCSYVTCYDKRDQPLGINFHFPIMVKIILYSRRDKKKVCDLYDLNLESIFEEETFMGCQTNRIAIYRWAACGTIKISWKKPSQV